MEVMGRWQHQHEQPATWCMRLEWWPRVVALAPWTHACSCWAMARRRGGGSRCRAGTKKRVGKNDAREKGCVHFYARCRPVCQLPKDGEGIWSTLGHEFFSFFPQKTWMGKEYGRCSYATSSATQVARLGLGCRLRALRRTEKVLRTRLVRELFVDHDKKKKSVINNSTRENCVISLSNKDPPHDRNSNRS